MTKSVTEKPRTINITHGYARCSTNETKQDIMRQVRELKAAGAQKIWMDYEHGDAQSKAQQDLMFSDTIPGDTVVTTEVPRLARSTKQLCEIIDIVKAKRLRLIIIGSITMDCRNGSPDPMTEAFLQMAGVFAQVELAMIRARVKSGVENARAKGKRLGRPPICADGVPDSFLRYYPRYKTGTLNVSEMARLCQVSRPTIYRWIGAVEEDKKGA